MEFLFSFPNRTMGSMEEETFTLTDFPFLCEGKGKGKVFDETRRGQVLEF